MELPIERNGFKFVATIPDSYLTKPDTLIIHALYSIPDSVLVTHPDNPPLLVNTINGEVNHLTEMERLQLDMNGYL
jgi:hypothetical protein